jgi:nitrite reductase (NADH) large subunit
VIVVGNGMVGHRFCESLANRDTASRYRIVCFGDEPRAAYDRVHLSELFAGTKPEALALADGDAYAARRVALHVGERVTAVDRARQAVTSERGRTLRYDVLVLATGSAPFVPPLPGIELDGVFTYRTIEDVERIRTWGRRAHRAAVIGGGLLGLEAAKAALDMGLETYVIEFAPRLMPRQVDDVGGAVLRQAVEAMGVRVLTTARTTAIVGDGSVAGLALEGGDLLDVDMVIVSAGIRARDELAREAGLAVGVRGGIVIDDELRTSDPDIHCIGESALHRETIYGLVGPGYEMADVLAARLCGEDRRFTGTDLSTKLKLLGIDVASFGDAFAEKPGTRSVVYEDRLRNVYQRLVLSADGARLLGGILVGDAEPYAGLVAAMRSQRPVPARPHELLWGGGAVPEGDDGLVCACNGVTRGAVCAAIRDHGLESVADVKARTRAATGCGGCAPVVQKLLDATLARAGRTVVRRLCEHFAHTRQELFQIVKINRLRSFEAILASHGTGGGCEVCRPAVASILASTWNDFVLAHATSQDTNDRFLANIQRGGTYSVVPRVPGGEITPEKLIVLGEVARRFDLYCKITGGQRIDLLGARVDQLPDIWEALVDAGFESGHAYGKAMRTVKSCVGTTWCRYGVQDSTALAIRLEERYRGIRAPHKLKAAVSGCVRECAEAQGKDFGLVATERGWNLYVGGNGGAQPRHADLLAADVDEATVVRLCDRFLMYYIHTADPLERTARWIERMDGGVAYLRSVLVDDALGICARLDEDMAALVATYRCEWAEVVRDPERRRAFRAAVNADAGPATLPFVRERGQKRPADWPPPSPVAPRTAPGSGSRWVRVARVDDVPRDGGVTIAHGDAPIAVFRFASRGAWYATQAVCPHRKDAVLGRGLLGTVGGVPKVACPLHKRTFSLETGEGLSDRQYCVRTYPVAVRGDEVWVQLPATSRIAAEEDACIPA